MDTLGKVDAAALRSQALSALRDGEVAAAIPLLERLVAESPRDAEALGYLGVALGAAGHPQEAVAILQRAATLAPEAAALHYNLGRALEQVGDLRAAHRAYEAAIQRDPEHRLAQEALHRVAALEDRTVALAAEAVAAAPTPNPTPVAPPVPPTRPAPSEERATETAVADLGAFVAAMNAPSKPMTRPNRWKSVGELLIVVLIVIVAAVALSQIAVRM